MSTEKISYVIIIVAAVIASLLLVSFKTNSPDSAKIVSDVSYFVDHRGCEFMVVRNHTEDAGLNTSLVNAYFQVVHMPTCNNVNHSK